MATRRETPKAHRQEWPLLGLWIQRSGTRVQEPPETKSSPPRRLCREPFDNYRYNGHGSGGAPEGQRGNNKQLQRDHLDNGQVINREPIPLGDHKDQQQAERLERSLAKCQGTNKGQKGQTRYRKGQIIGVKGQAGQVRDNPPNRQQLGRH